MRKQVVAELKKRSYITRTVLLLSLLYVFVAMVFGDTGLIRYFEMKDRHAALRAEVEALTKDNGALRADIEAHRNNDFYLEKYAREEYGLAKPDEHLFIYTE